MPRVERGTRDVHLIVFVVVNSVAGLCVDSQRCAHRLHQSGRKKWADDHCADAREQLNQRQHYHCVW